VRQIIDLANCRRAPVNQNPGRALQVPGARRTDRRADPLLHLSNHQETLMNKLLTATLAAMFAAVSASAFVATSAVAQEKKEEQKMEKAKPAKKKVVKHKKVVKKEAAKKDEMKK
jgi:hypothetical protein